MTHPETLRLIGELFESWYSSLVRYAMRITGSADAGEDIVQEAFVQLCQECRIGREIRSPKGWTLTVVRHQSMRYVAALKAERLSSAATAEEVADTHASEDSRRNPEIDDVTTLLSYLSSREEEVVLLRLQGMKYKEIAQELAIAIPSVSTLLARALRKLQRAARAQGMEFTRAPQIVRRNASSKSLQ